MRRLKKTGSFEVYARYAFLNVLGMVGLSCYILADTFFVARALGASGLASLNLAIPIFSLVNGCGLMFGMGGATRHAILHGREDHSAIDGVFSGTVMMTFAVSAVFLLVGMFLPDAIARVLGADEEVLGMTSTYLRVILMFAPMFMLNSLLQCFVRNDGAPHLAMVAMVAGSMSNVALDYVFMFPLGMGMFGAALATGLAPIFSMLVLALHFVRGDNTFRFLPGRFAASLVRDVVALGFPSFVSEVSSGIVIIVFNMLILGLKGNLGVAAYGVVANCSLVVIAIFTGLAYGMQPIVARCHGAADAHGARKTLLYALATVVLISAAIYGAIFTWADSISSVFDSGRDVQLLKIAVHGLKVYFFGTVFAGVNIVMAAYFTSTEMVRPAHLVSVLRGVVLIVPLAVVMSLAWGMSGVWAAFPAAEIAVCVVGWCAYIRSSWGGCRRSHNGNESKA